MCKLLLAKGQRGSRAHSTARHGMARTFLSFFVVVVSAASGGGAGAGTGAAGGALRTSGSKISHILSTVPVVSRVLDSRRF